VVWTTKKNFTTTELLPFGIGIIQQTPVAQVTGVLCFCGVTPKASFTFSQDPSFPSLHAALCHPYGILPPSFFMGSAGFTGGYRYVAPNGAFIYQQCHPSWT